MNMETDMISAACAALENALLLLAARKTEHHHEAVQDCLKDISQMADALLDTEDHADLAGWWGLPEQ